MSAAAEDLRFEYAAQLRDELRELRRDLREIQAGEADAGADEAEGDAGQVEADAGQVEAGAGQVEAEVGQVEAEVGQVEAEAARRGGGRRGRADAHPRSRLRRPLRFAPVDLDRQSIERRDFPIGRRGYDTAAVDGHLRALASEIEELERAAAGPGPDSLAASAGAQVQSIVAAAERAAAEIESEARASAESMREQAESAAAKIRADAVAQAQAHVAAVSRASATLLARVESMDGQVDALVQSLRAGASDLAGDLAAVQTNMGELYDAAAGRRSREAGAPADEAPPQSAGSPTQWRASRRPRGRPRQVHERREPSAAPAFPRRTPL